ncbi:MAG: hypothetical protein AMK72_12915 [Planctomycetes bacterium SM23_25]|nr:MAG: hypothetical protein AMK72_12915 [Planctomycetes bacterium SM23_25]
MRPVNEPHHRPRIPAREAQVAWAQSCEPAPMARWRARWTVRLPAQPSSEAPRRTTGNSSTRRCMTPCI